MAIWTVGERLRHFTDTIYFKLGKLYGVFTKGIFWFRLFGKGLEIRDTNKQSLSFSERYGYRKYLRLGSWLIASTRPLFKWEK